MAASGQIVAKAATLSARLKGELQESANERQAKIERDEERARRQQVRDLSFEHGIGGLVFKEESASASGVGAKGDSAMPRVISASPSLCPLREYSDSENSEDDTRAIRLASLRF